MPARVALIVERFLEHGADDAGLKVRVKVEARVMVLLGSSLVKDVVALLCFDSHGTRSD